MNSWNIRKTKNSKSGCEWMKPFPDTQPPEKTAQPEPSRPSGKPRGWLRAALTALLAVAAGAAYAVYALPRSCETQAVEEASAILLSQMRMYDNIYIPATAGTRTSLTYPLVALQQILEDTRRVEVPACLRTAKNELAGYMGSVIRAFEAFTDGQPDAAIQDLLDDSYVHIRAFLAELETVEQCAPYCLPRLR